MYTDNFEKSMVLADSAVSNLQLQLAEDSSEWFIFVQWSPPSYDGRQLLGYRVFNEVITIGDCQVINNSSNAGVVGSQRLDNTATNCRFGGLTPWRRYRVTVSSMYSIGEANASATVMSQGIGERSELSADVD
jgi:hypothetical protein